jgi:hypothetical protein
MRHDEIVDLLAEGFTLTCEIPNVTLVVLWGNTVCGVDTSWAMDAQFKILEGLLDRKAEPIGWLGLDHNLDLVALLPLPEHFDEAHQELLLKAYEVKTSRSAAAARRHWEGTAERAVRVEYENVETVVVEEFGDFLEGMMARVRNGGRP